MPCLDSGVTRAMKSRPARFAAFGLLVPMILGAASGASADVSRECRGVAAGVVAGMRAQGELVGQDAVSAAVVAARRACAAALEGFEPSELSTAASNKQAEASAADTGEEEEEPGVWDLLTRDKELTKGNERLRRLRN